LNYEISVMDEHLEKEADIVRKYSKDQNSFSTRLM